MGGRFRIDSRRWVPRPRWRAWAAALLDRHRRRTARPGGPGRIFLRPPHRPGTAFRERTILASRTLLVSRALLPRIHLAVQPVLRERFWRDRTLLAASSARTLEVRAEKTLEIRKSAPRSVERILARPVAATAAPRPAPTPPLQLVFQRLRAPELALGAASRPLARTEPGLARRAAAKVRRMEQQPSGMVPARVMARRDAPAANASSASFAAPRGSGPVQGFWNGPAPGMPAAPQPAMPAINVEDLTDRVVRQIDHRLHAWRERTGF